jgi:hypothetical protein
MTNEQIDADHLRSNPRLRCVPDPRADRERRA